ncbi:MAG: hypothetical protein QOK48_1421, partial [Blastocatellia bacterium]|nr:hypothetical protein [Blastocatellia bacterium]
MPFRVNSWIAFLSRRKAIHELTRRMKFTVSAVSFCLLLTSTTLAQSRPTRLAVLDFGKEQIGLRAAAVIRESLNVKAEPRQFTVIDRDQASAAALGTGFEGSLNLTIQDARNLGATMDCDFFLIGQAQTLRRSPSTKPAYYEAYATLFL